MPVTPRKQIPQHQPPEEIANPEFVRRGTSSQTTLDVSMFEFLNERIKAIDDRFFAMVDYQKELILVRFEAAQEAIRKADEATEKRFASVNEFRQTLSDQTKSFITRELFESSVKEVSSVSNRVSNIEGRIWAVGFCLAVFNILVVFGVHFIK